MTTNCLRCKAPMALDDKFCSECGADTDVELEIAAFHGPALDAARKWILAIGIIYIVSAFVIVELAGGALDESTKNFILGTNAALCVIHVGLYFWARVQPFPAAVVALCLFITLQLANAVLDPGSLYKGIIIKVLFFAALFRAVKAGHEAQKLRAQRA